MKITVTTLGFIVAVVVMGTVVAYNVVAPIAEESQAAKIEAFKNRNN